jgi:hypothetical protein
MFNVQYFGTQIFSMTLPSLFKKIVHPTKHMQPLPATSTIPSRNPITRHTLAHGATPILAPAPRPTAPAGTGGYLIEESGAAPSDIALLNPEATVDSIQQELKSLQQKTQILFGVCIILTVLTCGIQIPALCVIYAALLKLQNCANFHQCQQIVPSIGKNELARHHKYKTLNKVRQMLKWAQNWMMGSIAILMMILLLLSCLYIVFANSIRS